MTDRFLFEIAPGWALGYDSLQWMLLRAKNRRGEREWQPVSFIASTKAVLLRSTAEKGCVPTPEGQAKFDALPDTFKEWMSQREQKAAA